MSKAKADCCFVCGSYFDGGFCRWKGEPFVSKGTAEICDYCLGVVVPQLYKQNESDPGIAMVGTSAGDIYCLSDMVSEGYDRRRAIASLKLVGQAMSLSRKQIKYKLEH